MDFLKYQTQNKDASFSSANHVFVSVVHVVKGVTVTQSIQKSITEAHTCELSPCGQRWVGISEEAETNQQQFLAGLADFYFYPGSSGNLWGFWSFKGGEVKRRHMISCNIWHNYCGGTTARDFFAELTGFYFWVFCFEDRVPPVGLATHTQK